MADLNAEYHQARTSAALFDVSGRGKLELTGPDAPSFLHNLCTNDVVNLPLGAGCEAFFTTAKAKVVAYALIYHVRISGGRDALWLDVASKELRHVSFTFVNLPVAVPPPDTLFGGYVEFTKLATGDFRYS